MSDDVDSKLKRPWKVGHDGPSRPIIETADIGLMLSLEAFNNGKWGPFDDEEDITQLVVNAVNAAPNKCLNHPWAKLDEWAGLWRCPECESDGKSQAIEAFMKKYHEKPRLAVGVSVFFVNGSQILLGERATSLKAGGMLSTPGGRIEMTENIFQCAIREAKEETGLTVTENNLSMLGFKEHFRFDDHYIMFYVIVNKFEGKIQNLEPDKCRGWGWWTINSIPVDNCTEPPEILQMLGEELFRRASL